MFGFIALGLGTVRADDAIRIALIDPFSGPTALQGESSLRHIQMAADDINASDLLDGRKFQLRPIDNKGNPQEALIALKHAIDQNIRIVMQGVGAHIAHALTEAISKHNDRHPGEAILFINYSAPDPALTNEKCNFWHFRFDSHSDMKLDALTTALAHDPTIQRVYLINQDYSYGQRVARKSREMLARKRPDIQVVGDELLNCTRSRRSRTLRLTSQRSRPPAPIRS
jgi:branched-chain amino acid transport system substrate-binding protein